MSATQTQLPGRNVRTSSTRAERIRDEINAALHEVRWMIDVSPKESRQKSIKRHLENALHENRFAIDAKRKEGAQRKIRRKRAR